jgi:multidrug resistance efflux pump
VLGALDASELALERRKWLARREQHARELRAAMAAHDGSRIPALRAQVDQAEAEVALQEELLKRTELVAPFDGIVARGDWTQSLGSPVARGDVLFEIAPLDRYRVILEVDERDIGDVRPGSKGVLTLSALPSESSSVVVERITPVATAEDSRNFFRVEARLEGDAAALRPGMEGVGKIRAGWRRIAWIWSHSITDWLRLWLWARLP